MWEEAHVLHAPALSIRRTNNWINNQAGILGIRLQSGCCPQAVCQRAEWGWREGQKPQGLHRPSGTGLSSLLPPCPLLPCRPPFLPWMSSLPGTIWPRPPPFSRLTAAYLTSPVKPTWLPCCPQAQEEVPLYTQSTLCFSPGKWPVKVYVSVVSKQSVSSARLSKTRTGPWCSLRPLPPAHSTSPHPCHSTLGA